MVNGDLITGCTASYVQSVRYDHGARRCWICLPILGHRRTDRPSLVCHGLLGVWAVSRFSGSCGPVDIMVGPAFYGFSLSIFFFPVSFTSLWYLSDHGDDNDDTL